MVSDPISDMLIRIKNAGNVGREKVLIPYSKIKESIASVLEKEKFIKSYIKKNIQNKPSLELGLYVDNHVPKIKNAKRLSKPSKRIYKSASEIRPVKNGFGLLVISTPKGVMSGYEARKIGVGGEALFIIW
jgi:small subunit ribosomal protein S8